MSEEKFETREALEAWVKRTERRRDEYRRAGRSALARNLTARIYEVKDAHDNLPQPPSIEE